MIVVTGATGKLGSAIVEQLLRLVSAEEIVASVRDPLKAPSIGELGVRVRRGDFEDADGLQHAFEGADQLLLVSSNVSARGGDPRVHHRAAIDAAKTVGVRRIVYTSHMAASDVSAFPPMRDHFATEAMLQASGVMWTALRNGFYASSAIDLISDGLKTGHIEAPFDGKVAWTTHIDLAEAAAVILTSEERYDGPTPALTGSVTLDLADLAAIASKVLDRPISRQVLSDDEMRVRLASRNLPARAIDIIMGLYVASRNGEFAPANPALETLLRRRPIEMREVILKASSK